MKVIVGADHAGFELKEKVKKFLGEKGIEVVDEGTDSTDSVDYPDYAEKVGKKVVSEEGALGVLVCGTGLGMCMAANKVKGVRAATCRSKEGAKLSREHNNANILCLGGKLQETGNALEVVDSFLNTPFSNEERHNRRIKEITDLEK